MTYHEQVSAFKVTVLRAALIRSGGCRAAAARDLGMRREYLQRLITQHGLKIPAPARAQARPA